MTASDPIPRLCACRGPEKDCSRYIVAGQGPTALGRSAAGGSRRSRPPAADRTMMVHVDAARHAGGASETAPGYGAVFICEAEVQVEILNPWRYAAITVARRMAQD